MSEKITFAIPGAPEGKEPHFGAGVASAAEIKAARGEAKAIETVEVDGKTIVDTGAPATLEVAPRARKTSPDANTNGGAK